MNGDTGISESLEPSAEVQDSSREPQDLLKTLILAVQMADLPTLYTLASEALKLDQIPLDLNTLPNPQQTDALRGCLLVYFLSFGTKIPRKFQLEAALGSLGGLDGIISSATGSGKTMIMILLLLLRPGELAILIVPLKRLQEAQLDAFTSFGIRSVIVNEDTPDDAELWKKIATGYYQNIITTMESMGKHDGHFGKFASLLRRRDRKFVNLVKRIQIDEAQNIYTAGIPKHNQPAFRPAYGNFDTIRMLFPKTTTVMAFSATFPPHILAVVKKKMLISPNHLFIRRTSNRPNIMYATHKVVGNLSNFQNLSFLLPSNYGFRPPMQIPPTVIFHDNIKECSNAALFVDNLLPARLRGLGIVKHYHGLMSKEYLDCTYREFQAGLCRILHTCPGMESGIDFNECHVITYGICGNSTQKIQRGGRAGRDPKDHALFLMMYEAWVDAVDVSEVPNKELEIDPDRPFDISNKKYPTKMERTSIHCITTLQERIKCLRRIFADYLQDDSSDALCYCTPFCCDRCHPFKFTSLFLGELYTGVKSKSNKRKKSPGFKNRAMKERIPLQLAIHTWRTEAHETDPLRAIRPASWIVDDVKIKKLSIILPTRIRMPADITTLLGETTDWSNEWSFGLFDVIHRFDNPAPIRPPSPTSSTHSSINAEPLAKRRKPLTIRIPPRPAFKEKTNLCNQRVTRSTTVQ